MDFIEFKITMFIIGAVIWCKWLFLTKCPHDVKATVYQRNNWTCGFANSAENPKCPRAKYADSQWQWWDPVGW